MAIEITPQKKSRATLFATIAGIIAAFLILTLAGSYLYFYITNRGLADKIQELKDNSLDLDQTIRNKENELSVFQRRIDDFGFLLTKHKYILNVFSAIEGKTIPFMWFKSFEFQPETDRAVLLSGETNSFFAIEQQIAVFKGHNLIEDVNLGEITINEEEGKIEFGLRLVFSPEIFEFKEIEPELEPEPGIIE